MSSFFYHFSAHFFSLFYGEWEWDWSLVLRHRLLWLMKLSGVFRHGMRLSLKTKKYVTALPMQPSFYSNTMIVASKSFFLYIHNSQSRAVSQWFFSINQASQSVQRACLRSVNQLPALSQSACKQCKGQSRKLQLSSIVLRSVCFLPILLQVFLYGSTQGIPLIRSGSFRRGGQTRTWLIAIGEMNQLSSICLSWFNSGNVLNSCCQSQLEYTLSIGFVVFTWSWMYAPNIS